MISLLYIFLITLSYFQSHYSIFNPTILFLFPLFFFQSHQNIFNHTILFSIPLFFFQSHYFISIPLFGVIPLPLFSYRLAG